ncbi:MAG: hypothetical protein MJZ89_06050 [Paludibacteraceae bacterium]|nr:hypothetical protein [Paludibacteraceae bacterium]
MTTTPTIGQMTIEMDDPAVFNVIKSFVRQLKGVTSVKVTQKPKAKMTEEEFYAKIDRARKSAEAGHVYRQKDGESIDEFVDRLLCTK